MFTSPTTTEGVRALTVSERSSRVWAGAGAEGRGERGYMGRGRVGGRRGGGWVEGGEEGGWRGAMWLRGWMVTGGVGDPL